MLVEIYPKGLPIFKPLYGETTVLATLANRSHLVIRYEISPADPDMFVVRPDSGVLAGKGKTIVGLELLQYSAIFEHGR